MVTAYRLPRQDKSLLVSSPASDAVPSLHVITVRRRCVVSFSGRLMNASWPPKQSLTLRVTAAVPEVTRSEKLITSPQWVTQFSNLEFRQQFTNCKATVTRKRTSCLGQQTKIPTRTKQHCSNLSRNLCPLPEFDGYHIFVLNGLRNSFSKVKSRHLFQAQRKEDMCTWRYTSTRSWPQNQMGVRSVSRPRPPYPWETSSGWPWDGLELGGPHSWSGQDDEEKHATVPGAGPLSSSQ
jgi:hypothetical protein